MPNTPVSNQNLGYYLSGYTDGEGSFCVSFSPRKKFLTKLEVRPSFSVSQNSDRREVLNLFRSYFNCGTIRPNRKDKTVKFEIRSLKLLVERIIPHFRQFPLLSAKQKEFKRFAQICKLMVNKEHRNHRGLKKIIEIAFMMNPSGTRKYNKGQLLSLI